jgi:hypothetical protein
MCGMQKWSRTFLNVTLKEKQTLGSGISDFQKLGLKKFLDKNCEWEV